jgi:8-oxo-dGTP pyrophosphatase MutT (NUDIX family)
MQKQYVLIYAPSENNTLPMVLKDRPEELKGMLNMPGGKIEEGEVVIEAARRELQEETGLTPRNIPVLMGRILGSKSEIHVIKIEVHEEPLRPREDETEVFSWHNRVSVCMHPKLMPNLRLVIPLCVSGATGWTVKDWDGNWRSFTHQVVLSLDKENPQAIQVNMPGVAFFH